MVYEYQYTFHYKIISTVVDSVNTCLYSIYLYILKYCIQKGKDSVL